MSKRGDQNDGTLACSRQAEITLKTLLWMAASPLDCVTPWAATAGKCCFWLEWSYSLGLFPCSENCETLAMNSPPKTRKNPGRNSGKAVPGIWPPWENYALLVSMLAPELNCWKYWPPTALKDYLWRVDPLTLLPDGNSRSPFTPGAALL